MNTKAKGLQYIPRPLSRVTSRTAPRSREQVLSELVSLQRQEGRLGKKLIIWTNNQKQTERHLRQVQKRMAFLERVLDQSGSAPRATSADNRAGNDDRREAATTREILPPEYSHLAQRRWDRADGPSASNQP